MHRVFQLADRCGLTGALGPALADGWIDGSEPVGGTDLVDHLREGVKRRVRETLDLDRLGTTLEWFAEFLLATGRVPFMPLGHAGDLTSAVYNAETLELFGEFIRRRGSKQKGREGKQLASDTIDSYVSALKTFRGLETHYRITLEVADNIRPAASKRTRQTQGPPGERRLKRGIRASHLRSLVAMGYDRSSARGLLEWAAALVVWNLLLRGAELGTVPKKPFDSARDATFGAIEFRAPCRDSAWQPWLVWDVVPTKDTHARLRNCPMAVQRRSTGALGSDPLCVYDAVVMAWQSAVGESPPTTGRASGVLAARAFFTGRGGNVWDTNDTRALAQRMASALNLDPAEFGGKSFRIGGATDWRNVFGADAERIITQRGRWHSDIGLLYQRALADVHLRGSAAVGDADSADLESLCRGWAQPATFR